METAQKIYAPYRPIESFSISDLETVRLILRGGSVLDWSKLNFNNKAAETFAKAHKLNINDPNDIEFINRIRDESIAYLIEEFGFPIPGPVRKANLIELLTMASQNKIRHRQFCACTLLKAMHVINHFDANEAKQAIEITDQNLMHAAEQRIYKVISQMMAQQLPIVEFMGGRKQRASMVTKLLSKTDPLSAQLFDKMRFRIVTASEDDLLPTIAFLTKNLFPFNHVLAGESYNTLFPFFSYCKNNKHLSKFIDKLQITPDIEDELLPVSNRYSSPNYSVIHWVTDMPIRVKDYKNAYKTDGVNPIPRPIIYVRIEIQLLDRKTHRKNERGNASHQRYKARQVDYVTKRLKVGLSGRKKKLA